MATRDEYIAAAQALAGIAQGYLAHVPAVFKPYIHMDEINKAINDAAVAAVDAAEKVRGAGDRVASKTQPQ